MRWKKTTVHNFKHNNPKAKWHKYFAWFPVLLIDGDTYCWMEYVERKGEYIHSWFYDYRALNNVK
jgi:hypothetical protein